jgi:hypothetical protein
MLRGSIHFALIALLLAFAACDNDDGSGSDDGLDTGGTADSGELDTTTGEETDSGDALDDTGDDTIAPDTDTDEDTGGKVWECQSEPGADPDFLPVLGCQADFEAVAADPLDASIPGAKSAKTVVDQADADTLYFQDSEKYQIHWDFCSKFLSGQGKPVVPPLGQFNQTEYYSPDRRFLLGAITFYEEPGVWVYEISPYDTADALMIGKAYALIADNAFFGEDLYFHPTSQTIEQEAKKLPPSVKIITTNELFAGITYQPLNLGTSYGTLQVMTSDELETEYVTFRDIVVLDRVPNDISVVAGIITGEFQTPLSHINVLSQNRGTPNMALIGADTNQKFKDLEGKWVKFTVGAFEWSVDETTKEEADAWWEDNKPGEVTIPNLDLSVQELVDTEDILDLENLSLGAALKKAIPAFGGKASNYGGLVHIGPKVPHPKAFAIPVYFYRKFMEDNGFDVWVEDMVADPLFQSSPQERDARLEALRDAIEKAPVDPVFEQMLLDKLNTDFPGTRMRFRSSTNAEDLDGFTGAGLYTSKSGDPNDPTSPVMDAVRTVWSSIWYFRAFEERSYRSIDHLAVGMALLVHPSYPSEHSNGVALTANIFDTTGLEPGFYVNVQAGGASVVKPEFGTTTDQFIYQYYSPGQPIVFLSHSNMIAAGQTVLTPSQTYQLGQALDAIHKYFMPAYGPSAGDPTKFYAMDVEFKFDWDDEGVPTLAVKQARPHPGWGL